MKLIIAGGGTGGHLFPALAIARAVKAEDPNSSILFVGTRHGIEARIIPETEFPIHFITARGIRRTGVASTLLAIGEIPFGVMQSIRVIREFRPSLVLRSGGVCVRFHPRSSCFGPYTHGDPGTEFNHGDYQ